MLTYIKRGRVLDYVPETDVPAGTALKVGAFVGVTNHLIPAGRIGSVELDGIYSIPLADGATFEQGAIVEIDANGNAVASGEFKFGFALDAAPSGATEVVALLEPTLDAIKG